MKWLGGIGVSLAVLLIAACATNTARAPGPDLTKLKTFYVVRTPEDERGTEKLIARRLTALGYRSIHGDSPTPPEKVDAIVTYNDRWKWDSTMYMIQLDIQIRDPWGAMLASGQVMRPSRQHTSPEDMVEETLGQIFNK